MPHQHATALHGCSGKIVVLHASITVVTLKSLLATSLLFLFQQHESIWNSLFSPHTMAITIFKPSYILRNLMKISALSYTVSRLPLCNFFVLDDECTFSHFDIVIMGLVRGNCLSAFYLVTGPWDVRISLHAFMMNCMYCFTPVP